MILTDLKPDEYAEVCGIAGGRALRQKLLLRGCSEGSTLRMINASGGPVVVDIRGNTLAIGHRMAEKIHVQRC